MGQVCRWTKAEIEYENGYRASTKTVYGETVIIWSDPDKNTGRCTITLVTDIFEGYADLIHVPHKLRLYRSNGNIYSWTNIKAESSQILTRRLRTQYNIDVEQPYPDLYATKTDAEIRAAIKEFKNQ